MPLYLFRRMLRITFAVFCAASNAWAQEPFMWQTEIDAARRANPVATSPGFRDLAARAYLDIATQGWSAVLTERDDIIFLIRADNRASCVVELDEVSAQDMRALSELVGSFRVDLPLSPETLHVLREAFVSLQPGQGCYLRTVKCTSTIGVLTDNVLELGTQPATLLSNASRIGVASLAIAGTDWLDTYSIGLCSIASLDVQEVVRIGQGRAIVRKDAVRQMIQWPIDGETVCVLTGKIPDFVDLNEKFTQLSGRLVPPNSEDSLIGALIGERGEVPNARLSYDVAGYIFGEMEAGWRCL